MPLWSSELPAVVRCVDVWYLSFPVESCSSRGRGLGDVDWCNDSTVGGPGEGFGEGGILGTSFGVCRRRSGVRVGLGNAAWEWVLDVGVLRV